MKQYTAKQIKNIAFLGHGGSGKTTLVDSILYYGKAVERIGKIADGTTVMDFDGEEKKRKTSVQLSCYPIEINDNASTVTILNNTSAPFKGYFMWGEYKNKYMKDMDWNYVEINPGDTFSAKTNITENKLKCFLWKNMDDITTISNVRERGTENGKD